MKDTVADLAILGGTPTFPQMLQVGTPSVGERSRLFERLHTALDNKWLTNGALVREFEERIAALAGVRHCVATCSGTMALQLLYQATGLTGEVIMPAMTYVATAHAASMLGLTPVFADVDPETGCLDPQRVETVLTPRTSAIVGVHLWGRPSPAGELEKVAAAHGLTLVFDAAHALGCSHQGRRIGGFGSAEMFSFHATKVVNCFEGGAVATNDDALAGELRALRTFGITTDGRSVGVGTNAKMTEASAAMGLTSLDAMATTVRHNRANHARYCAALRGLGGLTVADFDEAQEPNWQYVILRIDEAVTGIHRDLVMRILRAENAGAQRYFSPGCHQLEPYRSQRPVSLPHTERLAEQVLALPTGPAVGAADIDRICSIVRCAISHGPELTNRLGPRPTRPFATS
ncbi:DegT/DnrJ/EryC1/StrS aminotransferase family protein [Salinispora sp. H7-4]|uniref:DegT/DnrJ/EryC1/StrS family aminotransferase n=1 Tax=Salinispora sp. H7-4 TaxID=2748321 RepID=UPI0015D2B1C3|nr:aminotransferase class I/II-fold pyridoxal phosphate-dependent enzyme [Salinispora sp. H7-4]NYT92416.1 aminotransferase class I/II-fold pyridoxal phosphate-dependent enzyme [Salinispora sp. H7-4]